MPKILACWIGFTDLRAAQQNGTGKDGLGPIAQAVSHRQFDEVHLLNDIDDEKTNLFTSWLKTRTSSEIFTHKTNLSGPTRFAEIYEAAVSVINDILASHSGDIRLTFHLSPGTPQMAAVWVILGKTRFPAELIESSVQEGVQTTSVPFDIAVEFLPDLLKASDGRLEKLAAGLPSEAPAFSAIIHRCQQMKQVIVKARHIALRSVPVLIEGESGTGKEMLARAIHEASPRRQHPFIAVNCGAIPAELTEALLFGHEKGAYTGADKSTAGFFEAATKGTLFLDEIGELIFPAQVKLLRAIQEKEVVRVGATSPIPIDVRLVAATNRNLIEEVNAGRFRSDLFYRIAVAVLRLPPLRDRAGDLNPLIDHLLDRINTENAGEAGHEHKQLSVSAKNFMLHHPWPGNVRELQNTLLRAAVWSSGPSIELEDIRDAIIPTGSSTDQLLGRPLGDGFDLNEIVEQIERHYFQRAMDQAGGNKTKAAQLLGLKNYQTLTNRMKKWGMA